MIVCHGSTVAVAEPRILSAYHTLDFGVGFYTTSNEEQALQWAARVAARRKVTPTVNIYEFDSIAAGRALTEIRFDNPDEPWLDFTCANRSGRYSHKPYDIVYGPVADDDVYGTILLYEQGFLDKEAAIKRFKVKQLYNQILFHSPRSLIYLQYISHIITGGAHDGTK